MAIAFLHLGSNQGKPLQNLSESIQQIQNRLGSILVKSAVYKTEAWGLENQPDFHNQALKIETALDPNELLSTIKEIELDMGRSKSIRWGARIIDIDIILFEDYIIQQKNLEIPHRMLDKRNFVLVPLNEIASDYIHPILEKSIEELMVQCEDSKKVTRLEEVNG